MTTINQNNPLNGLLSRLGLGAPKAAQPAQQAASNVIDTVDRFVRQTPLNGALPDLGALTGGANKTQADAQKLQGDAQALRADQAQAQKLQQALQNDQASLTSADQLNPLSGPLGWAGLVLPLGLINVGANVIGHYQKLEQDAQALDQVLAKTQADAGQLKRDANGLSGDLKALKAQRDKLPLRGAQAPAALRDVDACLNDGQTAAHDAAGLADQITTAATAGRQVTGDITQRRFLSLNADVSAAQKAAAAVDLAPAQGAQAKVSRDQTKLTNDLKNPASFWPSF